MSTSLIKPTGFDYYTLLSQSIPHDKTTHYYDTLYNRDMSKSILLIFTPFGNSAWRNSLVLPYDVCYNDTVSLNWVRPNGDNAGTDYWIDITFPSATRFAILPASDLPTDCQLRIMALAPIGTF